MNAVSAVQILDPVVFDIRCAQRIAVQVHIESGGAVVVSECGLIGSHEIAGTLSEGMRLPAVGNIRIRIAAQIRDPEVVHVSCLFASVVSQVRGGKRALPRSPGRIGQRHHAAVCRAQVHVRISFAIIVSEHHGRRGGRASIGPVEGGNFVKAPAHVNWSERLIRGGDRHFLFRRIASRYGDFVDESPVGGLKCFDFERKTLEIEEHLFVVVGFTSGSRPICRGFECGAVASAQEQSDKRTHIEGRDNEIRRRTAELHMETAPLFLDESPSTSSNKKALVLMDGCQPCERNLAVI